MSDTPKPAATDNETVVIFHAIPDPTEKRHAHDLREVVCKSGTELLVMPPLMKLQGDNAIGHDQSHRYVRTKEVDEKGRAIFRPEPVGS